MRSFYSAQNIREVFDKKLNIIHKNEQYENHNNVLKKIGSK